MSRQLLAPCHSCPKVSYFPRTPRFNLFLFDLMFRYPNKIANIVSLLASDHMIEKTVAVSRSTFHKYE